MRSLQLNFVYKYERARADPLALLPPLSPTTQKADFCISSLYYYGRVYFLNSTSNQQIIQKNENENPIFTTLVKRCCLVRFTKE